MRRGKVVDVGTGVKEIKVGDEACYMAYTGLAVHHDGVRYLTMAEDEVIGITI
jgi:co-chaperonin GroES (HSP10)